MHSGVVMRPGGVRNSGLRPVGWGGKGGRRRGLLLRRGERLGERLGDMVLKQVLWWC